MKRKLSIADGLKGKLSSATPGSEPPSAETAKILPPAKLSKASQKASEMGNRDAIPGWSDPVSQSPRGSKEDQASPPLSPPASEVEMMSEEELEALSPARGGTVELTHPIPLPPGVLTQVALQLKALKRSRGACTLEGFFPRAYQLLCEEQRFLGGTEFRELAFIDAHGRRWRRVGEGFDYSKVPPIAELKFDPANLEESCKHLRSQFEGIKLARRNETLSGHVEECHKAIHRAREARKELLRARGGPSQRAIEVQSYSAFAHGELAFIGSQIPFLRDYLVLRGKRVAPATAERRVLAKRRTPEAEEKS